MKSARENQALLYAGDAEDRASSGDWAPRKSHGDSVKQLPASNHLGMNDDLLPFSERSARVREIRQDESVQRGSEGSDTPGREPKPRARNRGSTVRALLSKLGRKSEQKNGIRRGINLPKEDASSGTIHYAEAKDEIEPYPYDTGSIHHSRVRHFPRPEATEIGGETAGQDLDASGRYLKPKESRGAKPDSSKKTGVLNALRWRVASSRNRGYATLQTSERSPMKTNNVKVNGGTVPFEPLRCDTDEELVTETINILGLHCEDNSIDNPTSENITILEPASVPIFRHDLSSNMHEREPDLTEEEIVPTLKLVDSGVTLANEENTTAEATPPATTSLSGKAEDSLLQDSVASHSFEEEDKEDASQCLDKAEDDPPLPERAESQSFETEYGNDDGSEVYDTDASVYGTKFEEDDTQPVLVVSEESPSITRSLSESCAPPEVSFEEEPSEALSRIQLPAQGSIRSASSAEYIYSTDGSQTFTVLEQRDDEEDTFTEPEPHWNDTQRRTFADPVLSEDTELYLDPQDEMGYRSPLSDERRDDSSEAQTYQTQTQQQQQKIVIRSHDDNDDDANDEEDTYLQQQSPAATFSSDVGYYTAKRRRKKKKKKKSKKAKRQSRRQREQHDHSDGYQEGIQATWTSTAMDRIQDTIMIVDPLAEVLENVFCGPVHASGVPHSFSDNSIESSDGSSLEDYW